MFGLPCHQCKKEYTIGEPAVIPEPYVSPMDTECQGINEDIEDSRHPIDGIGSMLKMHGNRSFIVGLPGSKFDRHVIEVPRSLFSGNGTFICDNCIEQALKMSGVRRLGVIHRGKETRAMRILNMLAEEVI